MFSRPMLSFPLPPPTAPTRGMRLPFSGDFCGLDGAAAVLALFGPRSSPPSSPDAAGGLFSSSSLSSSSSSLSSICFRFLFLIPCAIAGMPTCPRLSGNGVGKPLGRTWRMVEPWIEGPKLMVRGDVNVKSPALLDGGRAVSRALDKERWVMLGETKRDGYSMVASGGVEGSSVAAALLNA